MQIQDLLQLGIPISADLVPTTGQGGVEFQTVFAEALAPPGDPPPPDGIGAVASEELKTSEPNAQSKKPDLSSDKIQNPLFVIGNAVNEIGAHQFPPQSDQLGADCQVSVVEIGPLSVVEHPEFSIETLARDLNASSSKEVVDGEFLSPEQFDDSQPVITDGKSWVEPVPVGKPTHTKDVSNAVVSAHVDSDIHQAELRMGSEQEPTAGKPEKSVSKTVEFVTTQPTEIQDAEEEAIATLEALGGNVPKEVLAKNDALNKKLLVTEPATKDPEDRLPIAKLVSEPNSRVVSEEKKPAQQSSQAEEKNPRQTSKEESEPHLMIPAKTSSDDTDSETNTEEFITKSEPKSKKGSENETHKEGVATRNELVTKEQNDSRQDHSGHQKPKEEVDALREKIQDHQDRLAFNVRRGVSFVLESLELGKLDITIRQEGNEVQTTIATQDVAARQALYVAQPSLQQSFSDKGFTMTSFQLMDAQSDSSQRQAHQEQAQSQSQFHGRDLQGTLNSFSPKKSASDGIDLWI